MAGLSLRCGDCGVQLRSVEEAQAHAEATSHTNFAESTEAVLNLVCADCGKPCRSQTEVDLHKKRTGHAEFTDKTMEAAKPIDLEAPPKPAAEAKDVDVSGSAEPQQLVAPEVNKEMLGELESMGFSTARATRALHFSGNSTIEGAINWLSEHQEDPDIDEMPMVPANSEANKPSLTAEEKKIKAQELRERARKKKEEEERRMEREKEKERIRIGKELLEAKKMEELNERKRIIELRRLEKEEEKRAREKIRQKLEEDKAERRRKLGLPAEAPAASKPSAPPPVEEKKSAFLPVRPATKAERMRDCLRNIKQQNKEEDAKVKRAFQTLLTYIGNVVKNPDEEKFRKIRLTNATFQERVGSLGGIEFLELCGFEKPEGEEILFLARDKVDKAVLNVAGAELNSAITNPFFGVL
ncbi:hypothetical protein ZWY2020_016297 [Hordeum vulgare]|nr:hypothetical protein ZWY2020_016297 [Hordeum vulgare]